MIFNEQEASVLSIDCVGKVHNPYILVKNGLGVFFPHGPWTIDLEMKNVFLSFFLEDLGVNV
jgi:hypothetical protein